MKQGQRVTSKWRETPDGAMQGTIIESWPDWTVILVKWDDGEELYEDRTSVIIHRKETAGSAVKES